MRILIALALVLSVVACGKRGPPQPPGPADQVTYPRSYPAR
jgi:predicted small lipoprotein YifL